MNLKKKNVLTVLLVIVIVVIIGIIGYLGYELINRTIKEGNSQEITDEFDSQIPTITEEELAELEQQQNENGEGGEQGENGGNGGSTENGGNGANSGNGGGSSSNRRSRSSSSSKSSGITIDGYSVVGTIRIPATGIKYSIFASPTPKALERGVGLVYTENGLNEPGNSVIAGHNYRNRLFFSKNKNLVVGNLIYIKDVTGVERTYQIYNKFVTNSQDASFYQRNTNGGREITLSTCTDQGTKTGERLIIFASEV